MKRLNVLLAASVVAAAMSLPAMAANAPATLSDPARVAANNEYKAAAAKAKDDRKAAYVECAKAADRVKEKACRKDANVAYKKATADARTAYRKTLGELQTAKK